MAWVILSHRHERKRSTRFEACTRGDGGGGFRGTWTPDKKVKTKPHGVHVILYFLWCVHHATPSAPIRFSLRYSCHVSDPIETFLLLFSRAPVLLLPFFIFWASIHAFWRHAESPSKLFSPLTRSAAAHSPLQLSYFTVTLENLNRLCLKDFLFWLLRRM